MEDFFDSAWTGSLDYVKSSIEKGVDINSQDTDGNTVLHIAFDYGQEDLIEYLIKNGINVNIQNKNGSTPLHCAVSYCNEGYISIIRELIENGANPDIQNLNGETVLHIIITHTASQFMYLPKNFFDAIRNVDIKDKKGLTPLHIAIERQGFDNIIKLIEMGADINIRNELGETALEHCVRRYNYCIAGSLEKRFRVHYLRVIQLLEFMEKERRDKLLFLLCIRSYNEASVFHNEFLPLDLFKLILYESRLLKDSR